MHRCFSLNDGVPGIAGFVFCGGMMEWGDSLWVRKISPGTKIFIDIGVRLTVKGEIICGEGNLISQPVIFQNNGKNKSGQIDLHNSKSAAFKNTRFLNLSMGLTAIYSNISVENCYFENTDHIT